MRAVIAVVVTSAALAACSSASDVLTTPGIATSTTPGATAEPSPETSLATTEPPASPSETTPSATQPTASTSAESEAAPVVVVVADDHGEPLDRVVLAEYGVGDGARELGFEACSECDPVRPAAPILTGPDIRDLIIADVVNARWQVVRDGTWDSVPFAAGERVIGTPIQGSDGYLYAAVGAGGERRVDALSPFDLSWAASSPLPVDEPGVLQQVNDEIRYGTTLVTTVQGRPELPMWSLDPTADRLTLRIADVERAFDLPSTWQMRSSSIARLDDGTVVAHVIVPNGDASPTSILVRFWLDGSYATGTITSLPVAADGRGGVAEAGWVQLDDAISLYTFPEYVGPDPLAGWVAPPLVTPDLDAVPRLLPIDAVGAPSEWLRSEGGVGEPSAARHYVQIWAQAGEDGVVTGLVDIHTGFAAAPINPASAPVDVDGWTIARSLRMGSDGFAHIVLQDADRVVSVWSLGVGEDATVEIANRLSTDRDGVGWGAPFDGDASWVPIVEGWEAGHAGRWLVGSTPDGRRFELAVNRSLPSAVLNPLSIGQPITLTRVGGHPALVFDRGDVVGLTYAPAPDTVVVIGAESTPDQLVAVAERLVAVDSATWETLTTPNPSTQDGCNSFFC